MAAARSAEEGADMFDSKKSLWNTNVTRSKQPAFHGARD
jgi:hypothetical protein